MLKNISTILFLMMLVSVTIADTKDYPYVIILEANAPELEVNDSMFYEISRNVVFPVNQYNIGKNSEVRKELTEDILPRFNNRNYRLDIMNIRGAIHCFRLSTTTATLPCMLLSRPSRFPKTTSICFE